MKKIFALLAVVLAVVSCQKEINGLPVDSNNEAAVSFSVALPDDATRAAGADSAKGGVTNVDMTQYDIRFILEVYDENGVLAKERMVNYTDAKETSFQLRLVPGRAYNFVVWADFVREDSQADLHYVTSAGLRSVKVNTDTWDVIDESRDAYTDVFTVHNFSSTSTIDMTLTRPFAKLRVVTNDIKEMISVRPAEVTVNYINTKFYDTFDAFTEEAKNLVYAPANLTATLLDAQKNPVDVYSEGYDALETSQTLFADYFFGAEDDRVMFTFDVKDNGGRDLPQVTFNTNIPVNRNYLTTVYGPILTDANNITVTINEAFENQDKPNDPPYYVEHKEAGSAEQLVEIFEDIEDATGETHIVLTGDIDLDDLLNAGILSTRANDSKLPIVIKNGKTVVLDLGGNTLTATDTTEKNFSIFDNRGTFTVKNGAMKLKANYNSGWNRYSAVLANNPGGVLTVDGVILEHLGGTDMAYGIDNLTNGKGTSAITTIQNSTVKSPYRAVRQFLNGVEAANELYVKAGAILEGENKSIFFHDPSKNANTGKLVVEEGAILNGDVYLFVTDGSTEWPVEVSIAESAVNKEVLTANVPAGYDVYVKDGKWVVEYGVEVNGDNVTIINAGGLKWLAAQVNAGDTFEGKTVKLGANIDLNNENWTPIGYWETFNGTFDGQNYTVKNLKHHGTEEDCYVGLFGYTENATIKNLNIENVDLKLVANADWAGGHMGALVGNIEGTTVIENITVKGDVKIDGDMEKKGAGRIGGVVGGNVAKVSFKNVVVDANAGSFVQGNTSIGGIAGQIQQVTTFENCSANIDVTAQQFYAGGIVGLAYQNTSFTHCVTSGNVSVLAGREGNNNDLYRVGAIAGGWDDHENLTLVLEGCSTTCELFGASADGRTATAFDCAGYVGRGYSAVVGAKVSVNGTVYEYAGEGVYKIGDSYVVNTGDALVAALAQKYNVTFGRDLKIDPANMSNAYGKTGVLVYNGQTIDGAGYKLDVKGAGGTWDSGICTSGGLIKNIWVTGSFRGVFIKGAEHTEKIVLDNVRIEGTTYTISIDQASNQGLEAKNSIFRGWTSYAATIGEVKFDTCTFGAGNGNNFSRPYAPTQYVNCTFEAGHQMDPRAAVTFENCTIGGVALTVENLATLVTYNIANASVK